MKLLSQSQASKDCTVCYINHPKTIRLTVVEPATALQSWRVMGMASEIFRRHPIL